MLRGELGVQLTAFDLAGDQVGDLDLPVEAGLGEPPRVLGGVQHDVDVVLAGVLGDVQAEVGHDVALLERVSLDADQLRREGVASRRQRAGVDRSAGQCGGEREREAGDDRGAGEAEGARHGRGPVR